MIHDLTSLFIQLVALVAKYRIILLFFACTGLGAAGAWLIAGMPFRQRLLDAPNERSSHTIPMPRGAGASLPGVFFPLSGASAILQRTPVRQSPTSACRTPARGRL